MTGTFNHGSRVEQSSYELAVGERVDNSIIGILGTAPDAKATDWQLNTPVFVSSVSQLATLGAAGTLYDNIETMLDEGAKRFVVVRIDEGVDTGAQLALAIGDRVQKTGIHAFSKAGSLGVPFAGIRLAPGMPANDALDGIASIAVTGEGAGYGPNTEVTVVGDGGSGTGAQLLPIISNDGKLTGVSIAKPGSGYAAPLVVTVTDPDGGNGATCTGSIGLVLNPLVAEAAAIGAEDGSHYYHDLPDGSDQAMMASIALCGSRNVSMYGPRGLKFINGVNVPMPSSPIAAAQQAVMDAKEGPHFAGSNIPVKSFVGTNRAIAAGAQANALNEARVNLLINRKGLRTWGVWTCASDPQWQFTPVVRTTNVVNRTIEEALLQYNDKPGNRAILDYVVATGRSILKGMEDDGWLLPGSKFDIAPVDDPDFVGDTNSPEKAVLGKYYFYMAFEVPSPMVDIATTAHRNTKVAYTMLFDSVTGQVSIAA